MPRSSFWELGCLEIEHQWGGHFRRMTDPLPGPVVPLEVRALAIAFFYAAGTGIGGVAAPWFFGVLIDTGSRGSLFGGYLLGAGLMLAAAMVVFKYGVDAERKSLEIVAAPLSTID
jgi:hypothetical protein